jgi:pimeloyl-ACP methyl ester carboxylesterase
MDFLATGLALAVMRCSRWSILPLLERRQTHLLDQWGGTRFEVRTHDGVVLDALFVPTPMPADPAAPPRLPVLIVHGWWQVKASMLAYATLLRARGHPCLLVDLRAHGRSGGRYVTFGCHERRDLCALLDRAQALGLLQGPVATLGLSLGAATVLQHAAIDARIAAVAALAPYTDMAAAVRSYARLYGRGLSHDWVLRGFDRAACRAGFAMQDASTIQAMAHIAAPVLIAVGTEDRNLSAAEHARALVAAKKNGPCRLIEAPGAHHFNIHHPRWTELMAAVADFCAAAPGVLSDEPRP